MADEVVYREAGRTYRVRGLAAKARAVFAASREAGDLIAERIAAANRALESRRGPHAVTYAEELNAVLGQTAALKVALWQARIPPRELPRPTGLDSDDAGGHSDYWDAGNPARTNIARIVTGRHREITPAATQPPRSGPEPVGH